MRFIFKVTVMLLTVSSMLMAGTLDEEFKLTKREWVEIKIEQIRYKFPKGISVVIMEDTIQIDKRITDADAKCTYSSAEKDLKYTKQEIQLLFKGYEWCDKMRYRLNNHIEEENKGGTSLKILDFHR